MRDKGRHRLIRELCQTTKAGSKNGGAGKVAYYGLRVAGAHSTKCAAAVGVVIRIMTAATSGGRWQVASGRSAPRQARGPLPCRMRMVKDGS